MPGLKFRVLIDSEKNEEIFRDIVVDENENFESFFQEILDSYGFKGNQMASFYVSNENWDKGEEISLLDLSEGEDNSMLDIMKDTPIKKHLSQPDQKFILVYDFLKMWIFLIELIEIQEETPSSPQLLISIGDSPSEDSKGLSDDFLMVSDETDETDEEDYGFGDFEDGFSDDDMNSFL
tara:strand:- start:584 stop:1120 length:537 start_codon:yes stop_codon:yes gene_type:complete